MMSQLGIRYLSLRSLKEISDGDVVIIKNRNLCYTEKSHWEGLFKSESQSVTIMENADAATCGKLKKIVVFQRIKKKKILIRKRY